MGIPENTYYGKLGEAIAWHLFPRMNKSNQWMDKNGIDFMLGHIQVQVKGDKNIAIKRNVYVELSEKSHKDQIWRPSPHPQGKESLWIFVTHGFYVKMSYDEMEPLTQGKIKKRCLETSWGFFIPEPEWKPYRHDHSLWVPWFEGITEVKLNLPDQPPPPPAKPWDMAEPSFDEVK